MNRTDLPNSLKGPQGPNQTNPIVLFQGVQSTVFVVFIYKSTETSGRPVVVTVASTMEEDFGEKNRSPIDGRETVKCTRNPTSGWENRSKI